MINVLQESLIQLLTQFLQLKTKCFPKPQNGGTFELDQPLIQFFSLGRPSVEVDLQALFPPSSPVRNDKWTRRNLVFSPQILSYRHTR